MISLIGMYRVVICFLVFLVPTTVTIVDATRPRIPVSSVSGRRSRVVALLTRGGDQASSSSENNSDPLPLSSTNESTDESSSARHVIIQEEVLFSRWRTLTNRRVRFADGRLVDFDVVGQAGSNRAVLIFAWDSKTKTVTLIQEYMPGANAMKFGVAAGLVENDKHSGYNDEDDPSLTAAKFELEEEAHLVGGTWILLTDDTIMDKYATTVVRTYLVLDPEKAINPKPLDDEEDITIAPGVTIPQIQEMIAKGEMNVVGGWACMVAIQKLRELGEI